MSKVLIIDDDERLAAPLADYFARFDLNLVGATHPEQGIELLEKETFELVILDVMLPEVDGFTLCKQIKKQWQIPIVMLSARGEVDDRLIGLELGADDYVAKPFEPRELVMRIQNILKRNPPAPAPSILKFKDLEIDTALEKVVVCGQEISLTSNEYRLLTVLGSAPGKDFSRDEILNILKGTEVEMLTRAVDILVSRLRQKLKPTDYIKTVWGAGYRFVAPKDNTETPS
ncbi:MAG: response regulator transcription factor [Acidiferrobacterales bacterium]|nr:response regulator transcription factor [Acidiferrobacterales bacterium]